MRFSVGKIAIGADTIGKATGISVRVDGGAQPIHAGGFQLPLEIELGDRTVTISVDYVEWSKTDIADVISGLYVDITCSNSDQDAARGITGLTLARCKVTSYEITSTQNGPVSYRLELQQTYSS